MRTLTHDAGDVTSTMPVWSPDGAYLLFQRREAGVVTLWTMRADGTEPSRVTQAIVATGDVDYDHYAWGPSPAP